MTTYSSILIMTYVDKHDVIRHTNMTSVDRHTNKQLIFIYIDYVRTKEILKNVLKKVLKRF